MNAKDDAASRLRAMFVLANRAFDLMSLDERHAVLSRMASLRYEHIEDRFMDGVHAVVLAKEQAEEAAKR